MQLALKDNLPFVHLKIGYRGTEIEIADVLVDTGSATTILAADQVAKIGIMPEPSDILFTIRGVGGIEAVFTRQVDYLKMDRRKIMGFEIEVGGILGTDFLLRTGAIVNLHDLELEFSGEAQALSES